MLEFHFNKVAGLQSPVCNFIKKETPIQVFFYKFCEYFFQRTVPCDFQFIVQFCTLNIIEYIFYQSSLLFIFFPKLSEFSIVATAEWSISLYFFSKKKEIKLKMNFFQLFSKRDAIWTMFVYKIYDF